MAGVDEGVRDGDMSWRWSLLWNLSELMSFDAGDLVGSHCVETGQGSWAFILDPSHVHISSLAHQLLDLLPAILQSFDNIPSERSPSSLFPFPALAHGLVLRH